MAKAKFQVKRIRDEADYKTGGNSDFMSFDEGDKMLAHFLGEADEKIDDPAFFPYQVHWIGKGSIPCAGDNCPYCDDGDRPRAKALTLWLVLEDTKGTEHEGGKVMVWDMPVSVIKQLRELHADEDEEIKGRLFRIRRVDEKAYVLTPKTAMLKKKEIAEALKGAMDLEDFLTQKLRKAMEGVAVARALEDNDDDDDDDDDKKKSKKSSAKGSKSKSKPDDDDDGDTTETNDDPDPDEAMPDEGANLEVTITKVSDENWLMVKYGDNDPEKVWGTADVDVTELGKGQVVAITYVTDEDDDKVLTEDPEEAPNAAKDDLPEEVEDVELVIAKINEEDQTMDLESDDLSFTLFFLDKGPASKVDFDDYSEGDKITVTAQKDSMGDMVATAVPEIVKDKKAKGGKGKTAAKKTGKGKK